MRSYGISNFEADGQNVARKTFFEMEIGGPGSSRFSINKELLAKPLPFMGYAETDDGEIDRGVVLAYRESDKTYDIAIFYSNDEEEIIYPSHYTPMYENLPPHSYLSVEYFPMFLYLFCNNTKVFISSGRNLNFVPLRFTLRTRSTLQ